MLEHDALGLRAAHLLNEAEGRHRLLRGRGRVSGEAVVARPRRAGGRAWRAATRGQRPGERLVSSGGGLTEREEGARRGPSLCSAQTRDEQSGGRRPLCRGSAERKD